MIIQSGVDFASYDKGDDRSPSSNTKRVQKRLVHVPGHEHTPEDQRVLTQS